MAKHTPLYAKHLELNAKMADFAGWEMPLYYGSQIEEHNAVRQNVGMFDVSHMNVVDIIGKDAHAFLHYLISNDIDKLKTIGKALYSGMLNENGGVIDDLIVYRLTERDYRMVINAATHDKDITWIKQVQQKFPDLEIKERTDFAMIAIQGPNAITKTQQLFTLKQQQATKDLGVFYGVDVDGWWIARTGYTGEDGYEIMVPAAQIVEFWQKLLDAKVTPCGLVSRDTLRLEAGMNLYGSDMDETTTPYESNMGWTVALEPMDRDFIGKQALLTQKQQGIKRKLVGLVLKERGILRAHQKVIVPNIGEGITTSGGFSPTLGLSIALARVPQATSDEVMVEIRDKQIPAQIIKPPFVRNGKKVF